MFRGESQDLCLFLPGGNLNLIVSWSGLIHNSDKRYTSYSAWNGESSTRMQILTCKVSSPLRSCLRCASFWVPCPLTSGQCYRAFPSNSEPEPSDLQATLEWIINWRIIHLSQSQGKQQGMLSVYKIQQWWIMSTGWQRNRKIHSKQDVWKHLIKHTLSNYPGFYLLRLCLSLCQ